MSAHETLVAIITEHRGDYEYHGCLCGWDAEHVMPHPVHVAMIIEDALHVQSVTADERPAVC